MNKQAKKKLELQLTAAIESILTKQDTGAAAKSKKTVRQASKAVAKKFNKALKSIEEKKKDAGKKKIKSKKKKSSAKTPLKNISDENAKIKRSYAKDSALPVETPENFSAETTRTENL